jgi:hypothetical protein
MEMRIPKIEKLQKLRPFTGPWIEIERLSNRCGNAHLGCARPIG